MSKRKPSKNAEPAAAAPANNSVRVNCFYCPTWFMRQVVLYALSPESWISLDINAISKIVIYIVPMINNILNKDLDYNVLWFQALIAGMLGMAGASSALCAFLAKNYACWSPLVHVSRCKPRARSALPESSRSEKSFWTTLITVVLTVVCFPYLDL